MINIKKSKKNTAIFTMVSTGISTAPTHAAKNDDPAGCNPAHQLTRAGVVAHKKRS